VDVFVQKIAPDAMLPSYAKPLDAGLDLRSSEDAVIKPLERKLISTGIAVALPTNFVGLIWDRSGNSVRHGVHCMAGVIDAGYRGEIKVLMINLGNADFEVKKNDRIAQLLIQPVLQGDLRVVDKLDETHRGDTGFGSSGRN